MNDDELTVLVNLINAQSFAIRALILTHPDPEKVKQFYDQLYDQAILNKLTLDNPKIKEILFLATEKLFQPIQKI